MENNERLINDFEKKIGLAEAAVKNQFENIGDIIFAADSEEKKSSKTVEILNEIEKIDAEITFERERINNILNTVERADEIEALRKSLTENIRSIEKDNISNYETIGRASFEAYKAGELPADKYERIFGDIVKILVKIDDSESEKARLEEKREDGGVLERLKSGARTLFLKNSISSYYHQLQRQYKKAGEQICHSELIMTLEAESVENAVKPFKENLQGIEKLAQEDLKLTSENEKLKGSLEGLGVQANPIKTISAIEKHVNDLYLERKSKQAAAGEMISLNRKDVLAKIPAVVVILKSIDKQKKDIAGWRDGIKRCEAEIEIERKNKEIRSLNKKITGFEEKISNYSQEAEQLKAKISLAEENIKKLADTAEDGEKTNG